MGAEHSAYAVEIDGASRFISFLSLDAGSLADGSTESWVNLAVAGNWEGHSSGAFTLTPEKFAQMVANFQKRSETPLKFDYEHQTRNGSDGPKPASGYIKQLETRDGGNELWGKVEWTPKAAEMIKAGEYRYCSPVINFDAVDRKTGQPCGAELFQAALTGDPFLVGLKPIQLSRTAPASSSDVVSAAVELSAVDSPSQQPSSGDAGDPEKKKGNPFQKNGDKPADAPADAEPDPKDPNEPAEPTEATDPTAAPPTEPVEPADPAQTLLSTIAEAAGVDLATTISALMKSLDPLVRLVQAVAQSNVTSQETVHMSAADDKNKDDAARMLALEAETLKASTIEMSAQLKQIQEERAKEKAEKVAERVDGLIKTGFVKDSQREEAIWAFTANPEHAAKIFSNKLVPLDVPAQAGAEKDAADKPAAGARANATTVSLSDLSCVEKQTVSCMVGANVKQSDAIARVVALRDGRNN